MVAAGVAGRRRGAVGLAAVLGLALAGSGCSNRHAAVRVEEPTAKVEHGTMDVVIKASGEIRASKSSTVISKTKRAGTLGLWWPRAIA